MSAEDRLEFGMLATGRMVEIREVRNGKRCACECPACHAPLVARQGEIRRWHFSHASGHVACGYGAETALHRMAKQIIAQWNELVLPEHTILVRHEDPIVGARSRTRTIPTTRFVVRSSRLESREDGFTPDVILHGHEDARLAIEVRVTHGVGREKRDRIFESDLPMLEYDLSMHSRDGWDSASLTLALLEMAPCWIHHPAEAGIRKELSAELLAEGERLRLVALESARAHSTLGIPTNPDPEEVAARAPSRLFRTPALPQALHLRDEHVEIVSNLHGPVVAWARTPERAKQLEILSWLIRDATSFGLTCSPIIHTPGHGLFTATGPDHRGWAKSVASRRSITSPTANPNPIHHSKEQAS